MKKLIIKIILFYQRKAPKEVREACLFEPSCSNYMLMAIEKYGTFRGLIKGIKRIMKCHPPNGGEDFP